jgi:hypothetical protein
MRDRSRKSEPEKREHNRDCVQTDLPSHPLTSLCEHKASFLGGLASSPMGEGRAPGERGRAHCGASATTRDSPAS